MADKVDDGGSAFPQPDLSGYGMGPREIDGRYDVRGMTLRDWFAGQAPKLSDDVNIQHAEALAGYTIPKPTGSLSLANREECLANARFWADADAAQRYIWADAMLAARKEPRS